MINRLLPKGYDPHLEGERGSDDERIHIFGFYSVGRKYLIPMLIERLELATANIRLGDHRAAYRMLYENGVIQALLETAIAANSESSKEEQRKPDPKCG